jgi:hypothetical protein
MAGADEIRWARRVRQDQIRRLYALDAKGIVDETLIDEVGYAMLARCESIRAATRAHSGHARCPRCRTEVSRASAETRTWRKEEPLVCSCGWATTWGDYHTTYRRKQLVGGGAYPAFLAFIERWPQARAPRDKLLAIDALIHACHGEFKNGGYGRLAACNLIEGRQPELVRFLDELAYGPGTTEGLAATRERWTRGVDASPWLQTMRRAATGDASGADEE